MRWSASLGAADRVGLATRRSIVAKNTTSNTAGAKGATVRWLEAPVKHDYPAAGSYLRLLADPAVIEAVTQALEKAPTVAQHAKDVLRAAGLPLLPPDDPEVAKDLKKAAKGMRLSPILLVRGDLATGRGVQIADGYHRVCASYHLDEDTEIPCRLVDLPVVIA
jgi:hypothetical protein